MEKKLLTTVVAIDGVSGSGKSSTAKRLAQTLNAFYVDTGAMYRAVTYFCLESGFPLSEEKKIAKLVSKLHFDMNSDGELIVETQVLGDKLRTPEISRHVSNYCQIPAVREQLVLAQRALGLSRPSVVDGRDIGTVVFPDAAYKFFFWASPEIRAERRFQELQKKGIEANYSEVLENLIERDEKDTGRTLSPLKKADDAILIDTSKVSFEQQLEEILGHIPVENFVTLQKS